MPKTIRVDNRPEFISRTYRRYCLDNDISTQYIQPGKPVQNGFIERFYGSYRREYNDIRPHNALNNQPPSKYKLNAIL